MRNAKCAGTQTSMERPYCSFLYCGLKLPIVNDKVSEIIQSVLSQNYKFFHSIVWFKHFTLYDFEFVTKKIPELSRLVNNINLDVSTVLIRMNKVGS